ncbi:MAG: LLM class flavin-dependent oxidoreductase, partial [Acidimicrobiales bacterium]
MIVELQLNQGAADWPRMREAIIAAEEAGFSTLWNLDHFSGAMFGAESMSECFTSLGAWAAVTRTIGLGTLVVNAVNR